MADDRLKSGSLKGSMALKNQFLSLCKIHRIACLQATTRFIVAGLILLASTGAASGQTSIASTEKNAGFRTGGVAPGSAQAGMSADALINLLQQQPMLMRAAKIKMAQALSVDPETLTDQMLFDRIRQDANLRLQITLELKKRGYNTSEGMMQPGGTMPGSQTPFGTPAQTGPVSQFESQIQFGNRTQNQYGGQPPLNYQTPYASQPQGPYAQPSGYGNTNQSFGCVPIGSAQSGYGQAGMAGSQTGNGSQPQNGVPAGGALQSTNGPTWGSNGQPLDNPAQFNCPPYTGAQSGGWPLQNQLPSPATQQLVSPYSNLPSLRDLYTQLLPPQTNLTRFGSDVFALGTGNPDSLPMDLPAGPDYVLGPGDILTLNIWGSQPQTLSEMIDRQGQIALPEAGAVEIAGSTIAAAQEAIRKALQTQYRDAHVEISLGRVHTVRVYVVGDVQRPGAYDVSSLSTPLNALYAAGGPTSEGSMRILRQNRGDKLVREIDLYDFLLHGVRTGVERLLNGDTILVPPVGAQVTVTGMVRRPAIYELKGGESLKDAIEMAGGITVSANLSQIHVDRVEANERRTMLSIRLKAQPGAVTEDGRNRRPDERAESVELTASGGASAHRESPAGDNAGGSADPALPAEESEAMRELAVLQAHDGDTIEILPILPYNEQVVYLDGHVYRPGRYPYHEGMTVNELLKSYQDVLPEPADHLELIRLKAPDYRPETIALNLPDVLRGNDPILLMPFDVVRVFSRYEIDAPMVTIEGEVLRPGTYPLERGMTATALIAMAGGFRQSAYRRTADLATYDIGNDSRVTLTHRALDLDDALRGDKGADAELKRGDVLSVRQLTGWNDVGSSVTVAGEIGHPGVYGISEGERLSSVLERAGGLRSIGYPQGAVLERIQVREIGERSRQDLIRRIQSEDLTSMIASGSQTPQEQAQMLQTMHQQQEQALAALQNQPAPGRLVIHISQDVSRWQNTQDDIEMRDGDILTIPKKAAFVMVTGEVYSPAALTFSPGKTAGWYLTQAGGVTNVGDKRNIFVVRADGSVVGKQGRFHESVLSVRIRPGDSVVVPEKIVGNPLWKNLLTVAQMMSATSLTAAVATGL